MESSEKRCFYNRCGVSFMHHKANTSGGIFLFY